MKTDFLKQMARLKERRLEAKMKCRPTESVREEALRSIPPRPLIEALSTSGPSIIGEIKKASPSAGPIRRGADVADIAASLARGGASAISVLTEESYFHGSLSDLVKVREAVSLPLLRKDFLLDAYDLYESRIHGADAVLLIVAFLGPSRLAGLMDEADALGLTCLVEVHDEKELIWAQKAGAGLVGINNRSLTTLEIDLGTVLKLAPKAGQGTLVVAESGYRCREEILAAYRAGAQAFLIGETLMTGENIEENLRRLKGEGE